MSVQSTFTGMEENRGYLYDRTKHNDLEKPFADHWEDENEVRPWLNQGCGLLQNLFLTRNFGCHHTVTRSERYVAATVIQWLGTNCGFSFLQSCLRSCGLYITEIPKHGPLLDPVKPPRFFGRRID